MIGSVGTQSSAANAILNAGSGQRAGYGGMRARQLDATPPIDTAAAAKRIVADFDVDGSGSVDVAELRQVLSDNGIEGADDLARQLADGLGGDDGALTEQGLKDRFDRQQRAMNVRIDLMQMQAAMSQGVRVPQTPGDAPDRAPDSAPVSAPEAVDASTAQGDTAEAQAASPAPAETEAVVTSAATMASGAPDAAPAVGVSNRVGDFMRRYDTDGDGTVQNSEIEAVLADRGVASPGDAAAAMLRRFGGTNDALSSEQVADALRASDRAAAGLWASGSAIDEIAAVASMPAADALQEIATRLDGTGSADPLAVVDPDAPPTSSEASATDSGTTAAGDPAPVVAASGETASGESASGESAPGEAASGDAASVDAPSVASGSAAASGSTAPSGSTGATAEPAVTAAAGVDAAASSDGVSSRFSQLDTDGDGLISPSEFASIDGGASAATAASGTSAPATVVTPDVSVRIGSLLDTYRRMSGDASFDDLRPMFSAQA